MNQLCVVEAGCISKTIESNRKSRLLSYVTENLSLFDAIYSITDAGAVRTTRVLESETGLDFRINGDIGRCLSSKNGWASAHRGAVNLIEVLSQEQPTGVIVVIGRISMRTLVGAALREIRGGPEKAEAIMMGWQEFGTVAAVADIASQHLVEPIREFDIDLSQTTKSMSGKL